ncbi:MAG TPA: hypothetical protein VN222_11645, partial [Novosphingobium sp.]|nr:hypothetical protein [Novosphingobium sp.]
QQGGGPESLLPPGFDRPAPRRAAPERAPTRQPEAQPSIAAQPVIEQQGAAAAPAPAVHRGPVNLPDGITSFDQLIALPTGQLDALLGLTPRYDIPPGAQRAMRQVGIIDTAEGGLPGMGLAHQPAELVRAALSGNRGQMVSRWGHVLLRRALASRLDAPDGMAPAEFIALRASLLLRMGEGDAARALVQDVDPGNYDANLTQAAMDAYVATADLTGLCPVMPLQAATRKDPQWLAWGAICAAFSGGGNAGLAQLDHMAVAGTMPRIDISLAQKYAGAAGIAGRGGRRAVAIKWDGVSDMTPWRYALATGVGLTPPASLMKDAGPAYDYVTALAPMVGLGLRADASDRAGGAGVLSSAAMVDLYSQIYANDDVTGDAADRALLLRDAYVAETPDARLKAMQQLWDGAASPMQRYGRMTLTAYAAARLPAGSDLAGSAGDILASMLAAGLDANALRWRGVVEPGSEGWAQLALAAPMGGAVDGGPIETFRGADKSTGQHRTAMLVAGLAGLGRLNDAARRDEGGKSFAHFEAHSRWSDAIDTAAAQNNPALVALLAGLGMQGDSWVRMTPRYLYHIVAALNRVGLGAEARMIAAEAVARG